MTRSLQMVIQQHRVKLQTVTRATVGSDEKEPNIILVPVFFISLITEPCRLPPVFDFLVTRPESFKRDVTFFRHDSKWS
jgi:hypothetical protein